MKIKLKVKYLVLVILLFIFCTNIYLNVTRYRISAPMEDIEYKKAIIKSSGNPFYKLENLRPLMGEKELTWYIKTNTNNEAIYTPSKENIYSGIFQMNLHIHSTNSDGQATVKQLLDRAQYYAQNFIKDGYLIIGITDHNTVSGSKEIIEILQKYPNKYRNIKIVTGMEINSVYKTKYSPLTPVQIHLLAFCINPYDKFLNKEFYKKNKSDKYNRKEQDPSFNDTVKNMSQYSIVGVAHPARYLTNIKESDRPAYLNEMFDDYKKQTSKVPFTEAYYQSYSSHEIKTFEGVKQLTREEYAKIPIEERDKLLYGERFNQFRENIKKIADNKGIMKTGSTDSHSYSIFKR